MKLTVDQIASSSSSLSLGVRCEYSPGGPIRFAVVEVPWTLFTPELVDHLVKNTGVIFNAYLDTEPLF